jgi:hypothetical protein
LRKLWKMNAGGLINRGLLLVAGKDYIIGTLQCTGLTNQFTIGAPATVINIEDSDNLFSHYKCSATADTDAKSAAVALGGIKYGTNRQLKNLF